MMPRPIPYDIQDSEAAQRPNPTRTSPSQMSGTILLVEDELLIGLSLQEFLRDEGFEVQYHVAGKEAMSASETLSLRAAVVDLMLEDCSGADVVRRIRAIHPQALIVLITAADPGHLWGLAEEVGLHVLLKPFMEQRLLQILREHSPGRERA